MFPYARFVLTCSITSIFSSKPIPTCKIWIHDGMFQQNVECFHKMWGVMEQTTLFLPIITPSKLMVCVHVSINSDNIVSAFVFE